VRATTAASWCRGFLAALEGTAEITEAGRAGGRRAAPAAAPRAGRGQKTKRVPTSTQRPGIT